MYEAASSGARQGGGGRQGGAVFSSDKSPIGAESGFVKAGGLFPCSGKRSYVRPFLHNTQHGSKGHSGPRKAAARTCAGVWPILPAEANVSHFQASNVSFRDWGYLTSSLPRALRGATGKTESLA